jgi:2'-5' RNA ligase
VSQSKTDSAIKLHPSSNTLLRGFVAFTLSCRERTTTKALVETINQHRLANHTIEWVIKENLHITLKFLGNITLSKGKKLLTHIEQRLNIKQPLILETGKLIVLPNQKHPKVLALSVRKTKPLMNLAALTDQLAAALNIKRSARPYLPHLTLGYLKKHADVS